MAFPAEFYTPRPQGRPPRPGRGLGGSERRIRGGEPPERRLLAFGRLDPKLGGWATIPWILGLEGFGAISSTTNEYRLYRSVLGR